MAMLSDARGEQRASGRGESAKGMGESAKGRGESAKGRARVREREGKGARGGRAAQRRWRR